MPFSFGQKYGNYTIINKEPLIKPKKPRGSYVIWWCKCECGHEQWVNECNLGRTKKCVKCQGKKGGANWIWSGYKDISGTYWNNLKRSAERRNIEFDLTIEEAWEIFQKQNGKCAYSGLS